jgi:hypothetical protein
MHRFTKTGSGQAYGKLKQKTRFCRDCYLKTAPARPSKMDTRYIRINIIITSINVIYML